MSWVVAVLVVLLYVHLFNIIAPMYFASDRSLKLMDIWGVVKTNLGIV